MNPSDRNSHTFLGLPRLPNRYAAVVMPLLLSVLMTCVVSLISTWRSIGWSNHFWQVWPGAWLISWVVAFPTLLMVLPVVRRLTAALVKPT